MTARTQDRQASPRMPGALVSHSEGRAALVERSFRPAWSSDVFIRTDGALWEVEARTGGTAGRSTVHQCLGLASAEILAGAWMCGRPEWREVAT